VFDAIVHLPDQASVHFENVIWTGADVTALITRPTARGRASATRDFDTQPPNKKNSMPGLVATVTVDRLKTRYKGMVA